MCAIPIECRPGADAFIEPFIGHLTVPLSCLFLVDGTEPVVSMEDNQIHAFHNFLKFPIKVTGAYIVIELHDPPR